MEHVDLCNLLWSRDAGAIVHFRRIVDHRLQRIQELRKLIHVYIRCRAVDIDLEAVFIAVVGEHFGIFLGAERQDGLCGISDIDAVDIAVTKLIIRLPHCHVERLLGFLYDRIAELVSKICHLDHPFCFGCSCILR